MPKEMQASNSAQTLLNRSCGPVKRPGRDVHELQRMRERLAYLEGCKPVSVNGNGAAMKGDEWRIGTDRHNSLRC